VVSTRRTPRLRQRGTRSLLVGGVDQHRITRTLASHHVRIVLVGSDNDFVDAHVGGVVVRRASQRVGRRAGTGGRDHPFTLPKNRVVSVTGLYRGRMTAADALTGANAPDSTSGNQYDISVILPCYNERDHVVAEIDRIRVALDASDYSYEDHRGRRLLHRRSNEVLPPRGRHPTDHVAAQRRLGNGAAHWLAVLLAARWSCGPTPT